MEAPKFSLFVQSKGVICKCLLITNVLSKIFSNLGGDSVNLQMDQLRKTLFFDHQIHPCSRSLPSSDYFCNLPRYIIIDSNFSLPKFYTQMKSIYFNEVVSILKTLKQLPQFVLLMSFSSLFSSFFGSLNVNLETTISMQHKMHFYDIYVKL